jgi:hypothetical protein
VDSWVRTVPPPHESALKLGVAAFVRWAYRSKTAQTPATPTHAAMLGLRIRTGESAGPAELGSISAPPSGSCVNQPACDTKGRRNA